MSQSAAFGYRADIDGLRAIAVSMVLIHHFALVPGPEGGFFGVDVFFVISGFLITGIILRGLESRRFSLAEFYVRRIRRLAPALLTTLAGTLAFGAWWLFPVDFHELSLQALLTQFYCSNVYYWRSVNYFGLSADSVYLLHTWSLAVEEQFYLIHPVALMILMRLRSGWLWPSIGLATLASFALNLWLVTSKAEAAFYLLPTRAWELLAGALCFGWVRRSPVPRSAAREVLAVAGLALIAASLLLYRPDDPVPGSFACLPVLGTGAVIFANSFGATAVSRLLAMRGLIYLGKLSYPLYLVHWPIGVFARDVCQSMGIEYGLSIRVAMLGLSLFFAGVIYHFVELPIRHPREARPPGRLLAIYATSMALTVLVFGVSLATGGLPGRFSPQVLQVMEAADDHTPSIEECAYDVDRGIAASACLIGDAEAEPTWLVYGDSHAWAARQVFDEWLKHRGEAAHFVFETSCPPIEGVHLYGRQGRCHRFNEEAMAWALGSDGILDVLLVSTWRQALEGRLSDSATEMIDAREGVELFRRQFAATVTRYADAGKRVHVWEPVPGAKANVPRALARAIQRGEQDPGAALSIATREYRSTFRFFFESLEENRASIFRTYSPASLLCDEQACAPILEGRPVYYDGSHMARSLYPRWVEMMERADRAADALGGRGPAGDR